MSNLKLRLAALANSKIHSVRDGLCDPDEETAAQIYHLSLKARRCGIEAQSNPLRMLPLHLQKAERDAAQPTNEPAKTLEHKDKVARLGELADQLGSLCAKQLLQIKSRKSARELCALFRLGANGMRIWRNAMKQRSKNPPSPAKSPAARTLAIKQQTTPSKRPPQALASTPPPRPPRSPRNNIAVGGTRSKCPPPKRSRLGPAMKSEEEQPCVVDAEMVEACLLVSCAVAMASEDSQDDTESVQRLLTTKMEWGPTSRKRLCFSGCGIGEQITGKRIALPLPRGLTSALNNAPGALIQ